jgi:signal transduction histidine kinase/ligand-binding sensor domain-containing protein/CheY-like chemotaxis protein
MDITFLFRIFLLITLCILTCQCFEVEANEGDSLLVPVTTYSIKDGLLSKNIQDIVQDKEGFIWLGTQEGLSRFDSSEFLNFTKDKSDKYSLPDILVEDMILMPDGELWMSIYEIGITVFDKFTHKSSSIKNSDSKLFQLPNKNLYGIAKDKNNNIWFSLYGEGIYQWNVIENKFYKHLSSDENAWLTSKATFEIMIDSNNRLWVCTIDSKVYYYDINTGDSKVFDFSSDPDDPLSSPIYGFAESGNGEVYAGGFSGVFKFSEKTKSFDNIISKPMLSSHYDGQRTTVRRLMIDSKNNLWIGTNKSLLQYSKKGLNRVQFYENGEVIETPYLTIQSIIEGSNGNIWIGTEGIGLVKIAADWSRYKTYISLDKEPIDVRRSFLYEDQIWIVHTSSKIDLLELKNGNIQLKSSLYPHLSDDSIRIESIFQDSSDILWLSSVNGINKVNNQTGETSMVVNESGRQLGSISLFHKAKNKKFYFNFFGRNTIGFFDESEMIAEEIVNTDDNHLNSNVVNQIIEGLDGKLWFATGYGVETLNINEHKFGVVFNSSKELTVSNIYFSDNRTDVWMIADGGLYHLIWDGQKLHLQANRYLNILPLVKFSKIKSLQDNVMLITTEGHGLVEINIETLAYHVYTKENGLPSDVIQDIIFPNDIPLIVTESGVALYNQNFTAIAQTKPQLVFDEIILGGQKISPETKNLLLDYDYGQISFDMALLSFSNSSSFEYQYQLKGASNEWLSSGSDDKYPLINLQAGDYDFNVKGRSNYGQWSDVQTFSFAVKPAPWKTWIAFLLYGFALICVFYWLLYLYKRKLLYELEITKQQNQKHLANAASKAKSDFLARVSHEVRTPLNGVLGMGELLLDTKMDEEQQIYSDSIMVSGRHLLDIINDILDLSKIEAGKMELENEAFNLLELIDEVTATFASQAKQKELLFSCIVDSQLNMCRIGDALRIKQILFNLLSNSFKFTKQGEIVLNIYAAKDNQELIVFNVKDTGIGIDEKTIDELFKPFVQADSAVTRKFGGTGLGLAIVKQLTEKMQGSIQVKGVLNQGSNFEICLCLESNLLSEKEPCKEEGLEKVCIMLQEPSIEKSLTEYLRRLNVVHTHKINELTSCIFIDVLHKVTENQRQAIEYAKEQKIEIILLGFDLSKFNDSIVFDDSHMKMMIPTVTFNKLKQICDCDLEVKEIESEFKPKQISTRSLNLLVVEDHSINQQVSIEMLEKMGHLVDIVDSAEEALTMLARSKYDLLFVDYHLPGMDGLSMLSIWENKNHIPVIVVTADLTDNLFSQCHKMGIDNIVAKPFAQKDLAEAIDKAFNS